MTAKFFAILALLWIVFSIYWAFKASKDGVPAWYGLVISTAIVVVGGVTGLLLKVVLK